MWRWPILSYADPRLIHAIRVKTDRFRTHPYRFGTDAIRRYCAGAVLDIGGGFGVDYWTASALHQPITRWAVVEQPAVVRAAHSLNTDTVRFFSAVDEAARWLGPIDVAWSAGGFPYLAHLPDILRSLVRVRPCRIVATRHWPSDTARTAWQRSRLSENGPGPLPAHIPDRAVWYRRFDAPPSWYAVHLPGYTLTPLDDGWIAHQYAIAAQTSTLLATHAAAAPAAS